MFVLRVTVGLKHMKEAFSALFERLAQPHVLGSPAYAVLLQHCMFMAHSLYNTVQAERHEAWALGADRQSIALQCHDTWHLSADLTFYICKRVRKVFECLADKRKCLQLTNLTRGGITDLACLQQFQSVVHNITQPWSFRQQSLPQYPSRRVSQISEQLTLLCSAPLAAQAPSRYQYLMKHIFWHHRSSCGILQDQDIKDQYEHQCLHPQSSSILLSLLCQSEAIRRPNGAPVRSVPSCGTACCPSQSHLC